MPPDGDIDARAARQRAAHGPATGQRAAQRHDANGTAAGWNVGRTYTARQLTRSDKAYPGATDRGSPGRCYPTRYKADWVR